MKTGLLVASLLVNIWFATVIIDLEEFHYSVEIGMCGEPEVLNRAKWLICLEKQEPRTSGLWNLAYALKIIK